MANINNIRTLEDLTNVVNQLYFNLNKIEALYFNMFLNPTPLMLELDRYDENGQLGTVSVPNRAMDMQKAYTGSGNPNGKQVASVGSLYIDVSSRVIYYKSRSTGSEGWVEIWSAQNFVANTNYLPTDGNGSNLTNVNLSNDPIGILPVKNGGTGIGETELISGLVKANGNEKYTQAQDGVDYISPSSLRGIVCYYAGSEVPSGWIKCNGTKYNINGAYKNLFNLIGYTYGGSASEGKFAVPNLMDNVPDSHMIPIIKS